MSKQTNDAYEAHLNAIADAWAPAVKEACACKPSADVLDRIRKQALQEMAANRRRRFFVRLQPILVSAAAAAIICTVTLFALRPAPAPPAATPTPPLQPATALNGILMLANGADAYSDATTELLQSNSDAESLAWRLLEVQGFVDAENETLLAYM